MSDGKCLLNAYTRVASLNEQGKRAMYVQGTVTNPYTRKTFQHAWLELPDIELVIDPTIDVRLNMKKYYETFTPKNVIRIDGFTATMLAAKGGLRFYTKAEVTAMEAHVRELDKKYRAKRQGR